MLIDISDDELLALERLLLRPAPSRAALMNNLAARGLVWQTRRTCTLTQAGWRVIGAHRFGADRRTEKPIFHQF